MVPEPHSEDDWKRLADLLVQRRKQIDHRYSNRRVFCEERGVDYRVVSDIEGARRDNFSAPMIAALEVAYRVAPGSFKQALADPTLVEFPHRITGTVHEVTLSTSAGTSPTVERVDPAALAEKLPPPLDLPEHLVGAWHRFSLAEKWLWWTPDTTDLMRSTLVQVLQTMENAHARIAGASHPDAGDGRAHRAM